MWQSVCQTDQHIERSAGSKDINAENNTIIITKTATATRRS